MIKCFSLTNFQFTAQSYRELNIEKEYRRRKLRRHFSFFSSVFFVFQVFNFREFFL